MNKYMPIDDEKKYYEVSTMAARDLYDVLCKELSFNKMIELYKLIKHKTEFLGDKPIGFMNENELVDFLLETKKLEDMIDENLLEEDKDIEKLKIEHGTKCYLTKHSYLIANKINELIDVVNELKNK